MDLNITFKGQSTCFEIVFSLSPFAAFLSRRAVRIKGKLRRSHRHITGCLCTDSALWNCGEKSPAAASGVPYWCRLCGCLDASRWSFCARVRCHTSAWCKAGNLSPRAGIYLEQRPEQKTTSYFVSAFLSLPQNAPQCVCACMCAKLTHAHTLEEGSQAPQGAAGVLQLVECLCFSQDEPLAWWLLPLMKSSEFHRHINHCCTAGRRWWEGRKRRWRRRRVKWGYNRREPNRYELRRQMVCGLKALKDSMF